METEEIIEELREMEHMIELDEEQLPELEGGEPWAANWVRFHDALTGTMVCVNEGNTEDEEELGTVIIVSENDITIPPEQVKKYINIEKDKSDNLAILNSNGSNLFDDRVEAFRSFNHMIEVKLEDTPKGWVAFHDTVSKKTVCINKANTMYENEPVGTVVVLSEVNMTISEVNVNKYLEVQQKQSSRLSHLVENTNTDKVKSQIEYKF